MDGIIFLIIFIAVVAIQRKLYNRLIPEKVEYRCAFSVSDAHEGDEIQMLEWVCNRMFLPVPWLKVDIHTSSWLDYAQSMSVVAQNSRTVTSIHTLKGRQRVTRHWRLKCLKRGVYTTRNVTLIWGDILGISLGSVPVSVNMRLTVYPEVLNIEEMFIPVNYLQGDTIVKRWIIDDPFIISGTREYTSRDPMNRIHWKATARENRLMVRKNDFTSQLSLTVILNIQSEEYEYCDVVDRDKIELGIKVAATIMDRALRMSLPVRFGTNGCTLDESDKMVFTRTGSGKAHISELLTILAKLELKNVRDFEDFMKGIDKELEGDEVIIVTSYANRAICDILRKLIIQGNRIKLVVLDYYSENRDLPGEIDVYYLSGVDFKNAGIA